MGTTARATSKVAPVLASFATLLAFTLALLLPGLLLGLSFALVVLSPLPLPFGVASLYQQLLAE